MAGNSPLSPATSGLALAPTLILSSDLGSMTLVWLLGLKKKKNAGAPERSKSTELMSETTFYSLFNGCH